MLKVKQTSVFKPFKKISQITQVAGRATDWCQISSIIIFNYLHVLF